MEKLSFIAKIVTQGLFKIFQKIRTRFFQFSTGYFNSSKENVGIKDYRAEYEEDDSRKVYFASVAKKLEI